MLRSSSPCPSPLEEPVGASHSIAPEPRVSLDVLQRIAYRLLNGRSSLDSPRPSTSSVMFPDGAEQPPRLGTSAHPSTYTANGNRCDPLLNYQGQQLPPVTCSPLRRSFHHRASASISSVGDARAQAVVAHRACPVHTEARAANTPHNAEDTNMFATGIPSSTDNTNIAMVAQNTPTGVLPLTTSSLARRHSPMGKSISESDFEPDNLQTPQYPDSMKRQRSFLRSITNHASISALRNRAWKRKAAVAEPMAPRAPREDDENEPTPRPKSKYSAHSATLSMRGRLRPKSIKRSKSSHALEAPAVPALPSGILEFGSKRPIAPPPQNKAHMFLASSTRSNVNRFYLPEDQDSGRTVVPKAASRVVSPLSSPSPVPPFLRRLRNRPPTEVSLEFGTKGSPQSDRALRRDTIYLDPSSSIFSHRRYKSADITTPTGSGYPSQSNSCSDSLDGASVVSPPLDYQALATPTESTSYTLQNQFPEDASEVGQDVSTAPNDTTEVSLGSFDINVLDRLLESELSLMESEGLWPSHATPSRKSSSCTSEVKHTRHGDDCSPHPLSSALSADSSDSPESSSPALYPTSFAAHHTVQLSSSLPVRSTAASIIVPVWSPPVESEETVDAASNEVSHIEDDEDDTLLDPQNTVAADVDAVKTESNVGLFGGAQTEATAGDSEVPSPLDTDINTPTESQPRSIFSAEHERAWAAFAAFRDDDEEADFMPVTDDERFLSFNQGDESCPSSSRRDSWGESEESFGAPHPWHYTTLSTIAEVSYATTATNALNLSDLHSTTTLSVGRIESNAAMHPETAARAVLPPPAPLAATRRMHVSAPPENHSFTRIMRDHMEISQPQSEAQFLNYQIELRNANETNGRLRNMVTELNLSVEQTRSALVANKTCVDKLQNAQAELEAKYKMLSQSSTKDKDENSRLYSEFMDMKSKYAVQADSYTSLQEELRLAQRMLAERTQDLVQAQLQSSTQEASISQLRNQLQLAQFASDEARIMLESERSDREEVCAELAEAIDEQKKAWKMAEFFKEEGSTLRLKFEEECTALTLERNELDKKLQVMKKELETSDRMLCVEKMRAYRAEELTIPRLEDRIECLTSLLRDASGELSPDDSVRSQDSALSTVIDQETDLIALRRAVDAKDVELQDVTYQFERHKRACRRDMSDLREDIAGLQTEIKDLKTDLATAREETETHRTRAAEYFQRNKSCLAELDRINLIGYQCKNELEALRSHAKMASLTEAELERRIVHLEENRATLEQQVQVNMLRRQTPQPVTPQRPKRSISRAHLTPSRTPTLVSRLKDRDSPSPTNKKLRLKRAAAQPIPTQIFPCQEERSGEDKDRVKDPLSPTAKHNASPSANGSPVSTRVPSTSGASVVSVTSGPSLIAPTKTAIKMRTHSVPLARPRSVLNSTRSAIPAPKTKRKLRQYE